MLNEIKMNYEVSENQSNLFTNAHRKHNVTIVYNGKQYTTSYQCNERELPTKEDVVDCLLLDASAYDNANDILDFANEFGYDMENIKEVRRIYNACAKTSKAMHRIFTDEEIQTLYNEINQ